MLVRFDPFQDFDRLTRKLTTVRPAWLPMDAVRRGDEVVVSIDLPGVDPGSIDVTVEKDTLTVRAERRLDVAESDRALVTERPRGRFARRLYLGQALDGERAEARYDNGVLTLTVPVAEKSRARKVEITTGAAEAIPAESAAA